MASERIHLSITPRPVGKSEQVFFGDLMQPGEGYEVQVPDVWVEVDIDKNWRAAFRLAVFAGQPIVAELRVLPRDEWADRNPGESRCNVIGLSARRLDGATGVGLKTGNFAKIHHGLSAPMMRKIPFNAVRRLSKEFSEKLAEAVEKAGSVFGANELGASAFMFAIEVKNQRRTANKRSDQGWSDLTYAKLARAYVQRVNAGSAKPVADVASRRRLSPEQVRDAIHTARKRGLLSQAVTRGRPGGQLTPAAEALLNTSPKAKR